MLLYVITNDRSTVKFMRSSSKPFRLAVLLLRRLEVHRLLRKPRIIEQKPKTFQADPALADVLVPVNARAQLALAVVNVNRFDQLESHYAAELADRRLVVLLRRERIAGGKRDGKCRGKPPALRILNPSRIVGQMLEAVRPGCCPARR